MDFRKRPEEENPAMRAYLAECGKRLARREGRSYKGDLADVDTRAAGNWYVEGAEVAQHAREEFKRLRAEALEAMGLEALEIELLSGLDRRWKGVQAVEDFLVSDKVFLVLGGDPGTGKTVAAASSLLTCVAHHDGYDAWAPGKGFFVKASTIARYQNFGPEADEAWRKVRERKLLVVDDLGQEPGSDYWRDNLNGLVDYRMRARLPTILTTNLSGAELTKRYGERTRRRLVDFGTFARCERPPTPIPTPENAS